MATSMDSDASPDSELPDDVLGLDGRDVRALTEYMYVQRVAEDMYRVYSEDGSFQVVEPDLGTCQCGDWEYRNPEGGCKHIRRVEFWTGRRDLPDGADRDAMDEHLVSAAEGNDV